MKTSVHREIVVEIEKVQLIHKRTKTKLLFCTKCGQETDFINIRETKRLDPGIETDIKSFCSG